MGKRASSDEQIVHAENRIWFVRSVRSVCPSERWDRDQLTKIRATPYNMDPGDAVDPQPIFREQPDEKPPDAEPPAPIPRNVMVRKWHLDKWGIPQAAGNVSRWLMVAIRGLDWAILMSAGPGSWPR